MMTDKILELRNKGYSLQRIGTLFNLTRQRIWQIINKNPNDYKRIKESIFLRDNYLCQWGNACDHEYDKLTLFRRKEKMVMHHIDGNHKNNDPKNLITLCICCHSKFHGLQNNEKIRRPLIKIHCISCKKELLIRDTDKKQYCSNVCKFNARKKYKNKEERQKACNERHKNYRSQYYKKKYEDPEYRELKRKTNREYQLRKKLSSLTS